MVPPGSNLGPDTLTSSFCIRGSTPVPVAPAAVPYEHVELPDSSVGVQVALVAEISVINTHVARCNPP